MKALLVLLSLTVGTAAALRTVHLMNWAVFVFEQATQP